MKLHTSVSSCSAKFLASLFTVLRKLAILTRRERGGEGEGEEWGSGGWYCPSHNAMK